MATIQNATDLFGVAKWIVDPTSGAGTHTTITSALASASSGDTVFVRPGTYTENFTLPAGINLTAFTGDGLESNVIVLGKISMTATGTSTISNIRLKTNGDFCVSVTGANTPVLNLENCYIDINNNNAIQLNNSNATISINYCFGDSATTGITPFVVTAGNLNVYYTFIQNSGASTTASTIAANTVTMRHCIFHYPITTSGTGSLNARFCRFETSSTNTLFLTHGGSTTADLAHCQLITGTATACTVSVGNAMNLQQCKVQTSNAAAIAGAGSVSYGQLTFNTSGVITTTTQTPLPNSNDSVSVKTPGAYPYTTVAQDCLILVDTSSSRTITPMASPATGQFHRIKDNVGSAASNNITITPSGKNIDGVASKTININYGSMSIIYNGTQWNVV